MFPLAAGSEPWNGQAWTGGVMQALSHAFAKASMFLAAGLVAESLGHDRIADLRGIGHAMPMTCSPARPRRIVPDSSAAER